MSETNVSLASVSNSSSVNTYCKFWEPESDAEKIVKRTTFVLLIVLGISFNIFVIILAARFTIRKNFHYLIMNMAVCALVLGVFYGFFQGCLALSSSHFLRPDLAAWLPVIVMAGASVWTSGYVQT